MEYLITGGAGFIGSKICERLENTDHEYICVDDLSKGKLDNIYDKNKFIEIDCSSKEFEKWLKYHKPKHIFHLCGQSSGERSHEDPSNDFIRNVLTTRRIISASQSNEELKTFSFASSMSVYGNKTYAKEIDSPQPISWYGKHKFISENLIKDFAKLRPEISFNILRLFNVYGSGQDLDDLKQGMVSIFIAMAIKEEIIKIKGPGERIRDFINVNDVVSAFIKSTERTLGNSFEIFNVGTGSGTKISKLVDIICSQVHARKEYLNQRTPYDQDFCSADISKTKKILNFNCEYELESELIKMINWAKKNY